PFVPGEVDAGDARHRAYSFYVAEVFPVPVPSRRPTTRPRPPTGGGPGAQCSAGIGTGFFTLQCRPTHVVTGELILLCLNVRSGLTLALLTPRVLADHPDLAGTADHSALRADSLNAWLNFHRHSGFWVRLRRPLISGRERRSYLWR